ncbi:hypothetical protein E1293_08935 [Actinomadura darangshiensis]|uniref:ABC transporter substrate-binding protein n=1 Tax=Actinomadura darangshiensis TaxID=705336 RepID=A0A4R5BLV4_9ACTN|nr:ABC transporter substrate-binding protein [Actinomadura darangshiensis]TDD86855.1 hypothetical protein E1293_08935 [Actinomadura darangshiensis]
MRKRPAVLLGAVLPAIASAAVACGSGSGAGSSAAFDPKTCQGGTLTVLNQSGLTEFDPARLYTSGGGALPTLVYRTLATRQRAPGEAGTKPVPDLATDLGKPSDDAKTWTYTLKDGLKFDDGTPITSKDVKYKGPYKGGGFVELAGTDAIFESPQHPYTRRLLDAVPTLAPLTA